MTRSLRFRSFVLIALLIVPLFPPRVRAAEDAAAPTSSPSMSIASTSTLEQMPTSEPVSVPTSTVSTTPESVPTTPSSTPALVQLPPPTLTSALNSIPAPTVSPAVAATSTAVTTTENQVTSSTISDDNRNENEDEDEDDALDLGDDQAELDARKDFTGVVRQSKPYTCGPAALATLLTQLGNDTSEDEVLEYVTPDTEKGVSLLSLKQAAQKLSASVMLKTWTADEVLSYVKTTSDPVLIHDEKAGVGGHFSVLREYHADKDMVELSDTEAGNITYSVADFRHIFTGSVLVVYEGEPTAELRDEHTMLGDEKAADIWGKYVPVYLLAEQSGNAKAAQDAQVFKTCIGRALAIVNYQSRNAARQACYSVLALNLKNDLSTSEEAKLIARYDVSLASPFNKNNEAGVGTSEMLGVLKSVLSNQDTYARKLSQFNQALQQGGGSLTNLSALQTQLATLQTKLSQASYDRDALSSSLLGKQVAVSQLNNELFSGLFVQNNQVFSLGAVGSQLNAQAATYQKLSQVLNSKLANLDAQINQKQAAISSYTKNQSTYQNQAAAAKNQANYWFNQVTIKKSQRKSFSYEQKNYQSYSTQAANASSNAQYYQNLINQASNDIANLRNQKTQAQTEVSTASAEKARLERLKAFGDQEVQRKKTLLKTLNDTIASLKTQLTTKAATIAALQPQIAPLQAKVQNLQQAKAYQNDLNFSASYIDGVKQRYGFTTLSYTNTAETQRLIAEELQLEKGWDTTTQVGATGDARKAVSDQIEYAKNHPGTVLAGAGFAMVYIGGSILCTAYSFGACTAVIQAANSVLLTYVVFDTANNSSVVLSNKDLFGNEVSDAEWGKAVGSLALNAGITVVSAASLKITMEAVKGVVESKRLINLLIYGTKLESSLAQVEIESTINAAMKLKLPTGDIVDLSKLVGYKSGMKVWSEDSGLTEADSLVNHWNKHKFEFPTFRSPSEYLEKTWSFISNPPKQTFSKVRLDGDTVMFDPMSQWFAIKRPDGTPRTMFVPDPKLNGGKSGLDYFNAQK